MRSVMELVQVLLRPWWLLSFVWVGVLIMGLLFRMYRALVAQPEKLRSALRKQGISGPNPTLLLGNMSEIRKAARTSAAKLQAPPPLPCHQHNCSEILFPVFQQWQRKYGDVFMFSLGNTLILHVTQHEIVREITKCRSLDLGRPSYQAKEWGALLGQGIITSNGTHWAHQRKIIAPELYLQKVKRMIKLVQESATSLISSWNNIIHEAEGGINAADIKIDQYMRSFSGDVISKACFGSNYSKGEEIFFKLRALQAYSSNRAFGIPGARYLPTKSNREAWVLEKEIKALILKVLKERNGSGYEKDDLLQMLLEVAKDSKLSQDALDRFMVDNCKDIYLAGYETTAVSATWCLMLLASNPQWQERVRAEVLHVCKGQLPNDEMIRQMKVLSMVINEALRLYPPVSIISREALRDMKFGEVRVPKGVNIWIFVLKLHTDPEIWGSDSYEFNPERFANGITGACKLPQLYMPFGMGPRVCLGQNLALMEMKILMSLILAHFSFTLSPTYTHSPAQHLVIEPQHGVHLHLTKL